MKKITEAELNELIAYMEDTIVGDDSSVHLDIDTAERDMIIDALTFYKEMNTY